MASRHSYSAAGLALLWGSCGCCLVAPLAAAGDKIEFSSPAMLGGVPQQEAEQKDNKTSPSTVRLSPYQSKAIYPVIGGTTLFIPNPRGADKHSWDSSLTPESDRRDLSGFGRPYPHDGPERATNNWSRQNIWNSDPSTGLEQRRSGDAAEPSAGEASREDASKAFGREAFRNQDRFGDRFSDSSLPWSQDADGHGPMALDRMRHGEFLPFGDDFKNLNESQAAGASAGGLRAGLDPLHTSSLPPGMPDYSSPAGSLLGGREGELFGTPAMAPAWDARDLSRPGPRNNSSLDQPWSAGAQNQAPPANLLWPKQPGSLFH